MKLILQSTLIATLIFATGCYTQLETVQREAPRSHAYERPAPDRGTAYHDYYDDDWAAYEEGYYDGVFDTEIAFRDYRRTQTRLHVGVGWGRPFYGFGFSYGYFYDPYWHWAQLYDPFFFSYYGFYAFPPHLRYYRPFAFFHSPFWGWGHRPIYIVQYNNWYVNRPLHAHRTGPRSSGVHRGNTAAVNTRQRNNVVDRAGSSRVRGASVGHASSSQRPGARVDRSRSTSERGTVDRNRGNTSRGTVDRNRGSSSSRGTVRRGNTNRSNSSGTVNRGNRSSGSSASPSRSRGSSSEGRSRNRGGNEISNLPAPDANQATQRTQQNQVRPRTTATSQSVHRPASVNTRPLERPAVSTINRNNGPAVGTTQRPAVNRNRVSNNNRSPNNTVNRPAQQRNTPSVRPSGNSNNNRSVQQNRTRKNSSATQRKRNSSRND